MNLYKLSNTKLEPIDHESFKLEKDIQLIVESNLAELFNLRLVRSEFTVGEFRIDTLCFDEETNSFVIVEYKKGNSYSVIDQGYSYLSIMLNNKADFILEYNEQVGTPLKRDEIDWSSSRVIFISPSFNTYQKNSVNFRDVPFELWEIKKFSSGLIALEKHVSNSRASIDSLSTLESGSVISRVTSEVSVASEDEHVSKASAEIAEVWRNLREHLDQLPDGNFYTTRSYIGFKRENSVVCFIEFKKSFLNIYMSIGNTFTTGEKSKNYFHLEDPKGVASEMSWTHKDGTKGYRYRVQVRSINDLDYLMYLLKQKYSSL